MERQIVLCGHCNGNGRVKNRTDFHGGDETVECKHCKGSGRLVKTVKVTFEPYTEN